jgi:hypothetical protein
MIVDDSGKTFSGSYTKYRHRSGIAGSELLRWWPKMIDDKRAVAVQTFYRPPRTHVHKGTGLNVEFVRVFVKEFVHTRLNLLTMSIYD